MKKKAGVTFSAAAVLMLFCITVSLPAAETVWGASVETVYRGASLKGETSHAAASTVELLFTMYGDFFSLQASAALSDQIAAAENGFELSVITLDSLVDALSFGSFSLEIYPLENLSYKIGRFTQRYGQSELFSPLNLFSTPNFQSLVQGDREALTTDRFLISASLFGRTLSFDLTAAPFLPVFKELSGENPWFPRSTIPEEFTVSSTTYELSTIGYGGPLFPETSQESPSVLAALSGFTYNTDWTLLWFSGWDPDMYINSEVQFLAGTGSFSLILRPVYRPMNAAGTALSTVIGPLRLYLDALYSFDKTVGLSRYTLAHYSSKNAKLRQDLVSADVLSITAGSSLDAPRLHTYMQAEYSRDIMFHEDTDQLSLPLLQHTLTFITRTDLLEGRILLNTLSVASLADFSFAVFPQILVSPSQEVLFSADIPLFFGEQTTEFGQYSSNYLFSLSCRLYY
jgi:hypothetical protein